MIDLEGENLDAVLLKNNAVSVELLDFNRNSLRRQLLVLRIVMSNAYARSR